MQNNFRYEISGGNKSVSINVNKRESGEFLYLDLDLKKYVLSGKMDLYNSLKHFKKTCSLQYFGGGGEKTKPYSMVCLASLVSQTIKNLPAVQETWVQSLGQENPLEKEWATHSSILAWEIPWIEELGRSQRVDVT